MQRRILFRRLPVLVALSFVLVFSLVSSLSAAPGPPVQSAAVTTYTNPLRLEIPGGGLAETCADPSVIKGQGTGDPYWYLYCTTDPLTSQDKVGADFNFRPVPMYRSTDLVSWIYVGDAFERSGTTRPLPDWAESSTGIWAPEIDYFNGKYYLYYGVTDVKPAISGDLATCHIDNAIGVATSDSPTGPWTDSGAPLILPRSPGAHPDPAGSGCTKDWFWTYDPEVIQAQDGRKYIYYGSYFGGIFVQELNAAGNARVGEPVQVAIGNRYEGAEVVYRDGFYYLFVSATNCCAGARTGYAVFVGRSATPTGPFVDQQGNSFVAGRVGGTPFLIQNGNEWIGVGHNTVFQDLSGQWWTIYHGVNRNDPYFAGTADFTKRPILLDPIDWINGWPTVNGGAGPSNMRQDSPVAKPGDTSTYQPQRVREDRLTGLIPQYSEEFNSTTLNSRWTWERQPTADQYQLTGSGFRFKTQDADLYEGNNTASVLRAAAPGGDYVVETRLSLDLPPEGCCFNYRQAGLVIYDDDNNYIKHVYVSIWETRQIEFAKEAQGRYGNTVSGPPADWTYLRIHVRQISGGELYTAYTSQDGKTWVRGGSWTHNLGSDAEIGLVSMGGPGFTAEFDYVRVYGLLTPRAYFPAFFGGGAQAGSPNSGG